MINVEDGKVLATFKVGGEPEGVELRPDGQVVYVTSEEDGQVAVIDAVNQKLLKTFKVGPRPRSTTFLPDNSRAFVTSENGGSVSYVDAQKHVVLKTIHDLRADRSGRWAAWPRRTASTCSSRPAAARTCVIIDAATQQPVAAIEVGDRPWGIAVSGDGKTLFTANGPSNDVSIVDVDSRMVKAKVKVGDRPWGVLFAP